MTSYPGKELEIFQHAVNWKRCWTAKISAYVVGDVLEVGSGIGGSIPFLMTDKVASWQALEPDAELVAKIPRDDPRIGVTHGVVHDVDRYFDCILYIDVLEHIEDDAGELAAAAQKLKNNGCLIVLSPAHDNLMSEFDRAIGHYRRYNKDSLLNITPDGLSVEKTLYLDSVGLLASIANRYLLKQSQPGTSQIAFWDNVMVPFSRLLDPLTGYLFGKTIVAIWRKPA